MSNRTLLSSLINCHQRPREAVALKFKRHKSWLSYDWIEYQQAVVSCAVGLKKLGLKKGDKVAVIANTRMEWAVLDFAILGLGGVTVPVYHTLKPDEMEWILKHSESKIVVVEKSTQWETLAKRVRGIEHVIVLDSTDDLPALAIDWGTLIKSSDGAEEFFRQAEAV